MTFISGNGLTEYMSLFTADSFDGEVGECDEGDLLWIPKDEIEELEIWEGDKIFLKLISDGQQPFFSLKLVYDGGERLLEAVLDGKPLSLEG